MVFLLVFLISPGIAFARAIWRERAIDFDELFQHACRHSEDFKVLYLILIFSYGLQGARFKGRSHPEFYAEPLSSVVCA